MMNDFYEDLEATELRLLETLWTLESALQFQLKLLKEMDLKLDSISLISSKKNIKPNKPIVIPKLDGIKKSKPSRKKDSKPMISSERPTTTSAQI